MAKDPDAMSDESIGYLEDVKKGKPRRFAMICKGTSVVSLVVYKKGSVEQRRKEAKESGKGQFYFGIVDGKGIDIRFVLARADGFESAPVKDTILKNYLADSADLKFKPTFEILDQLPELPIDDEEQLIPKATGEQESAPSESEAASPESNASDDQTAKLINALKAIKPLLDQVISSTPTREAELKDRFIAISACIKDQKHDQAKADLTDFAKLLKSLLASPTPTTSSPNNLADQYNRKREELSPTYQEALSGDQERASKLTAVWDFAQAQATAGNFDAAIKALEKLQTVLSKQLPPSSGSTNDFFDRWAQATSVWRDANDEVNAQISKLQQALKLTDDAELHEIAEYGLNALTGGTRVKLMAAIQEVNSGGNAVAPSIVAATKHAIAAFKNHITSDERVEACDENPFDVPMSIRTTLTPALEGLEKALTLVGG